MIGWLIAVLATIFVVALTLSAVFDWLNANKTPDSKYGELIKQHLAGGKYRIVAGIFDARDVRTAQSQWETEQLDETLAQAFGNRDTIRVEL